MSKGIILVWYTFDNKKQWAPIKNEIWKSIRFFKNMETEIEQCEEEVKITVGYNEPYYNEVIKEYLIWCSSIENTSHTKRELTVPQEFNLMNLLAYLQEERKLETIMPGPLPEDTDECITVMKHVCSDVFWKILLNYCETCRSRFDTAVELGYVNLWIFLTFRPKFAEFCWSTEHKRKKTLEFLKINLKKHNRFVKLSYKEALVDLKDFQSVKNYNTYFSSHCDDLDELFSKLGIDSKEKSDKNFKAEQRKQLIDLKNKTRKALEAYNRSRTTNREDVDVDEFYKMYLNCKQQLEEFEKNCTND